MTIKPTTSGFTLIELIVGMTIFSIGLAGVFALLQTTMSTVRYSRDEIVVSGLLREQIDLVMSIRDSNLRNYIPWDSVLIEPPASDSTLTAGTYIIENNYATTSIVIDPNSGTISNSPVKMRKLDIFPLSDADKWSVAQLRMDSQGRYIHSETTGTLTQYASYIVVSPLGYTGSTGFTEIRKG
jgi:prepilin-type N-terminal cleavage/methylation domain-containing protein